MHTLKYSVTFGTTLTFLSIEWNSMILGGPTHDIVTKTIHKNSARGGGMVGLVVAGVGVPGGAGVRGLGVWFLDVI